MFKKLIIDNFRSHKHTELEFVPGVNIIVGTPQSGKTNIVQALFLLATGQPEGGGYFPTFAGKKGNTHIALELDDGVVVDLTKKITISRTGKKGVDETVYLLGDKDWKGSKVPDLVKKKLNLSTLNFQKQLDKHFLVTSTPGEIAKVINQVTKLEPVDAWVSEFTTDINQANQEVKVLKGDVDNLEVDLKKYDDLEETERVINLLVSVSTELEKLQTRRIELRHLIVQIEEMEEGIAALQEDLVEAERFVSDVDELDLRAGALVAFRGIVQRIFDLDKELTDLRAGSSYFLGVQEEVAKIEQDLELLYLFRKIKARDKALVELQEELDHFLDVQEELDNIEGDLELLYLLSKIKVLGEELIDLRKDRDGQARDYAESIRVLKKCPTCFSPITDDQADLIVAELLEEGE